MVWNNLDHYSTLTEPVKIFVCKKSPQFVITWSIYVCIVTFLFTVCNHNPNHFIVHLYSLSRCMSSNFAHSLPGLISSETQSSIHKHSSQMSPDFTLHGSNCVNSSSRVIYRANTISKPYWIIKHYCLIHWGLVMAYGIKDLGQHWFSEWFGVIR